MPGYWTCLFVDSFKFLHDGWRREFRCIVSECCENVYHAYMHWYLNWWWQIWMCGGTLEQVMCSHVGHIFRHRSPYAWRTGTNVLKKNSIRLAEVWMDDYKKYYYERFNFDLVRSDAKPRAVLARSVLGVGVTINQSWLTNLIVGLCGSPINHLSSSNDFSFCRWRLQSVYCCFFFRKYFLEILIIIVKLRPSFCSFYLFCIKLFGF